MKVNNITGNNNQAFTTRYSCGNTDSEYVFTCQGRPFAVLVSDNLPTPTSGGYSAACPPLCFVASDLNTLLCRQWQDEATDGH